MGIIKEFKEFAMRGNVIDMAVGIIIGAAFGGIVSSLVKDVLMPPLGLAMGGVDFSDKAIVLKDAVAATDAVKAQDAVILKYGMFINQVINFIIVAFAIFIMIKAINTAKRKFEREKEAGSAPAPTTDQKLLMEIRDAIRAKA